MWFLAILVAILPSLSAQSGGNFEMRGEVPAGISAELRFRAQGALGYRVRFFGDGVGQLDDPGRREGLLAAPASPIAGGKPIAFRLTANGPKIELEIDGRPAWSYTEKVAAIPSIGAASFGPENGPLIRNLQLRALSDTPRSFAERYGPGIGERVPEFRAVDQAGKLQDLVSLRGPKGLWLLFVRSADWCVYCKTQLVELGMRAEAIARLGYNVAALSYDQPAALAHFARRKSIAFPLLADPDSKIIDAFGIRNEAATTGFAKGVPHPGYFILGADGRVEAKYMEEDYKERITASAVMSGSFGERAAPAGAAVDRPRIRVTPTASVSVVRGGQKVTLSAEAMLGRGLHAYAPGAPQEFIPVSWKLSPSPLFKAADPEWPVPETTKIFGFDEKVPNYTGVFRVSREISLAPQAALLKESAGGALTVQGEFRYQACNDHLCFPPETIPLTWNLLIEGADRERVPKELQRPDR
ncbi:MAG: redoxin domain-containing protein [Acidobacteria bacterium]|nr:redoxin domain-containing protein [Acidobacteriota bacterium]